MAFVIIAIGVILFITGMVMLETLYKGEGFVVLGCLVCLGGIVFGIFDGFINYPPTEGTHQGVLTAVDMEGIVFRRYKVYLKSSGYTNQSDETEYCLYLDENELKDKLRNFIGKEVQLSYGHPGGKIPFNSCGTYHITDVKLVEE